MKLRSLIVFGLILLPCLVFGANSVISFTDTLTSPVSQYVYAQTETPNPALTIVVADNLSHIVNLSTQAVSSLQPIIYLSMQFNGTGSGCIIRLMNSTTKSAWAAYPISSGASMGFGINPNEVTYLGYSSCYN